MARSSKNPKKQPEQLPLPLPLPRITVDTKVGFKCVGGGLTGYGRTPAIAFAMHRFELRTAA